MWDNHCIEIDVPVHSEINRCIWCFSLSLCALRNVFIPSFVWLILIYERLPISLRALMTGRAMWRNWFRPIYWKCCLQILDIGIQPIKMLFKCIWILWFYCHCGNHVIVKCKPVMMQNLNYLNSPFTQNYLLLYCVCYHSIWTSHDMPCFIWFPQYFLPHSRKNIEPLVLSYLCFITVKGSFHERFFIPIKRI